ncbi:hypothetical protein DTO169E5_2399 [Paecilomyces variotii]|nr:hypothetical protein DTO169E5_2399 [Paecilomyces variotii]
MDPTGRSAPFLPMITGIVRQQQHRNQLDPTEDDCKRGESKAPGVVDAQTGDGERWDLPGKFPAWALTGSHFSANRRLILYYYNMRTDHNNIDAPRHF